jgi:hypothetical protein
MKEGRETSPMRRGQTLSKEQNRYIDDLLSLESSYHFVRNERDEIEVIPKLFDIAKKVGCSPRAVQYRTNAKLRQQLREYELKTYKYCAKGFIAFGDLLKLS